MRDRVYLSSTTRPIRKTTQLKKLATDNKRDKNPIQTINIKSMKNLSTSNITIQNKKTEKHNKKVKVLNLATKDEVLTTKIRDNTINKIKQYGKEREEDFFEENLLDDYYEETQKKTEKPKLKVIFLGGVGEIGKNMTALEYDDEIVLVDFGSAFPDNEKLGVDLLIPDISYLEENSAKVKAILLTHGHEDHIGALPYLIDKVNAPIYGSKITLALVKNKLKESRADNKETNKNIDKEIKNLDNNVEYVCVDDQQVINLRSKKIKARTFSIGKNFKVEFVPVCHSIPGSYALYIQTPQVKVVHSGDFKIDFTPIGEKTDLTRLAEIGNEGVDLLLCESTNIGRAGFSMSEKKVGNTFKEIFSKNKNRRLIVATFASNISRLQQLLSLCEKYERKVVITGRSMLTVTEIASSKEINELHFDKNILTDITNMGKYSDGELLILCTGSQGECRSALSRMSTGEFPNIYLGDNDTVIISASTIPGNEKSINTTINNLYKLGCDVIYNELADVHVSGHACQEEIKTIHELVKPKNFIPIHGEYRHLRLHRDLALSMGMEESHTMICDKGDCVAVTKKGLKLLDKVKAGEMYVDGLSFGTAESNVIKERYILANEGICVILLMMSKTTKNLVCEPEIVTRGLVYKSESNSIVEDAKKMIQEFIAERKYEIYDASKIKTDVKRELLRYFSRTIDRKPMMLATIVETTTK